MCEYMKAKSCLTNQKVFCYEVNRLVDEGRTVVAVSLEFGEGFDTASSHLPLSPLTIIINKVWVT